MNRLFASLSIALALLACSRQSASTALAEGDVASQEDKAVQDAVARVARSVVRIETFGGLEKVGKVVVGVGPTTGLVVAEDGYIISSAFNFVQMPSSILVTLPSGKRAAAEIVARDQSRMLVLLKANSDEKLTVPEAAPRDDMVVGQWAIAVGRTFSPEHPNLSVGVLAARNRIWGKAIQTDAKISPSNYGGPLIDIRGRVLGVLVPLSPQKSGELAGAEWYDSGIGFAVPLEDILRRLEHLKKGQDLAPGVMGVSLKGDDIYSLPAEIAVVRAKSPAREAGLKPEDRIVELNGIPISRQAQLKHALGPLYAGDRVEVVVERGDAKEKVKAAFDLVDKLTPYEHPFLGLLPLRVEAEGVVVRYVYPDSPAAKVGVQPGDRIISLEGEAIADASQLRERLTAFEPKDSVKLAYLRGADKRETSVVLTSLPTDPPASLPPASARQEPPADERPPVGWFDVKLPEQANECAALAPSSYRNDTPHGLLVLLAAPGKYDKQAMQKTWEAACQAHDLILLAPKPENDRAWRPTEVEFIQKTIEQVQNDYNIDSERIVLHGFQAGGAMSFLAALDRRDLVRGIAPIDASLPARARVPENDPLYRLAIYWTYADKSRLTAAIKKRIEQLREAKYPVTERVQSDNAHPLDDSERADFLRWVDSLDKI